MENERENLHQLTGARDEVFALVLHDFCMDSHHSFSIMEYVFCFDLHAQFYAPNRNRKKVWPLERQKIRFRDEISRFAWPWWLSPPYIFEFHLWSMMCVGILRRKHLKNAVFVENGGLEGMRAPGLVLKKRELQDIDNASRSYGDRR